MQAQKKRGSKKKKDHLTITKQDIIALDHLSDKYPLILCVGGEKKWVAMVSDKLSKRMIRKAKLILNKIEQDLNKHSTILPSD